MIMGNVIFVPSGIEASRALKLCTCLGFDLGTSMISFYICSIGQPHWMYQLLELITVCCLSLCRETYLSYTGPCGHWKTSNMLVQWKAPPNPFSRSYLLTYGPLGGMMQYTMVIAPATSYNITGLLPFTSYRVTLQAHNVPDGEFPLCLSEVCQMPRFLLEQNLPLLLYLILVLGQVQ